ncbi:hypothetical protein D3C78_1514390 [compost metagenome]
MQVAGFFFQQHAERMEFLAQCHRHRVLQLGTTHFQDGFELFGLVVKAFAQLVDGVDQLLVGSVNRNAETGRVGVVGGLAFVKVVVRVQVLVFAFLMTHQFQTDIRQHFVGVHVQRSTCTALEHVYRELIHAFAFIQHFITGLDDDIGDFAWDGF